MLYNINSLDSSVGRATGCVVRTSQLGNEDFLP